MNNDLAQFSEESLQRYINQFAEDGMCDITDDEIMPLVRIALAAKQAKPVGYISERNLNALGKQFSVCVKHEPVMVRPIPIYTTPQPAHTERVIRDGWKLVPEEATIAMLTLLGMTGSFEFMQQKYKNMLAAAPKPESE